ncbi:MAG: SHOCT domain-containing protein [Mobilitalea sp.]
MGLFTNNKRPCPICGQGTPRLLATEIAGDVHLCSDCSVKISLGTTKVSDLTLEGLKEHLALREENANCIKNVFRPNKTYDIGWTHLNIDEANKLFTIPLNMCGDTKNPPVFKFEELMGYDLEEENCVIERFNRGDISPQCAPMLYAPVPQVTYDSEGRPLQQNVTRDFKLNLYLANPCWDKVESSGGSVTGNGNNFQRDYSQHLGKLRIVTTALVTMIGGAANGGNVMQSSAASISGDLMKFKELLEGGIITQEEFDAKKKQILGI